MSAIRDRINDLMLQHGSDVLYHREGNLVPCPCRTPEGYRNLEWHLQHRSEPLCNEEGFIHDPLTDTEFSVKAWVQPVTAARGTRLQAEIVVQNFADIEEDDHIGIFPESWGGKELNFYNWSQAGDDWIMYNGRKFMCVNANLIATPDTGEPRGHWEIGLRLISGDEFSV